MFKALVLTEKLIKHPHSTISRQIISQIKEQVEYSPIKSPKKPEYSPLSKTQKSLQKSNGLNYPFKLSEIEGNLKIFHQYQLQRIQDSFNQLLIDKKRQQIATLAHLKTNILAIINVLSQSQKNKILIKLAQLKEQIQTIDIFSQKHQKNAENFELIESYNIVVYFHNSLMSQEFYKLCYRQFMYLPIYLKQVIILQRQSSQQISYKDVLSSFKYIEPLSQKSEEKLQISEKDMTWFQSQQRQWIQLPKCVKCLLKLEFQVSGIDQKVLCFIAQSKNQQKGENEEKNIDICSTCLILSEHRKQADIHRKLSFQSDYKDHHKSEKHAHCDDCKEKSDIWICMVCGRVGCGRYKNADAHKHFIKSGHIITIDLQTQRVWNYLSDCFSHKLLKNINESASSVRFPEINKDENQKIEQSKLEAAFWQYCSVFSEEMQRQRIFYENIKNSQEEKFQQQNSRLEKIIKELQKQSEQKSLQLKRTLKKKTKVLKKHKQLQEKVSQERDILKQHEECLNSDFIKNFLQNDEDILTKKKQLQVLEAQLSQVLIHLSST